MTTANRSYLLTSSGGKISAALAKLCAEGEIGEPLLRSGVSQEAFCLFLARLAVAQLAKGKTDLQLADIFMLVSGANASAARQALGRCELQWEEIDAEGNSVLDASGNPTWTKTKQSVEAYWAKAGGSKTTPNLSLLD